MDRRRVQFGGSGRALPPCKTCQELEQRLRRELFEPAFTCPRCGAESYNRNDGLHRYCARCNLFFDADGRPTF